MSEFVHVGRHADVLASGRSVGPGEHLTDKDLDLEGEDKHLIDEGVLVDVSSFESGASSEPADAASKEELQARARELDIPGRSKMTVEELRQAVAEHEAAANDAPEEVSDAA